MIITVEGLDLTGRRRGSLLNVESSQNNKVRR